MDRSKDSVSNITWRLLELNAVVESMIQREGGGRYSCLECGKNMADKSKIKRHAEVHLDMSHPCIVCEKVFKTRNVLATHYTRDHPKQVSSPWTMQWKLYWSSLRFWNKNSQRKIFQMVITDDVGRSMLFCSVQCSLNVFRNLPGLMGCRLLCPPKE